MLLALVTLVMSGPNVWYNIYNKTNDQGEEAHPHHSGLTAWQGCAPYIRVVNMLYRLIIWIMRFVLLSMIYIFLYKVVKVMHSDLKGGGKRTEPSAGIEVVGVNGECSIPVGAVYPLHPVTDIGRAEDNNIVLDSVYVSGHHARIFLKNNEYILKDMKSTNGTFLNGNRMEKPEVIKDGDVLNIGGIVFKVID